MHCLTCHYDLAHLAENRCPECGRAFDPADPNTFLHNRSAQRGRWTPLGIGLAFIVGPVIMMFLIALFFLPLLMLLRSCSR